MGGWLEGQLAAHPDMIPDLRAYVVYALATTGGAPKDALDKAWASRDKLSDEGLALVGLALGAGNTAGTHGQRRRRCCSKRRPRRRKRCILERATTMSCSTMGRHISGDDGFCAEADGASRTAAAA
jgi:hypothetical protein